MPGTAYRDAPPRLHADVVTGGSEGCHKAFGLDVVHMETARALPFK
jgi:hypothetical protein